MDVRAPGPLRGPWNQFVRIGIIAVQVEWTDAEGVRWERYLGRPHDLRHTCVSLLLDLGVPPHIVREIAGHSALEVTMTIYAHASLEEKYRALTRLDERLAKERLSSRLSSESDRRDRLGDLSVY